MGNCTHENAYHFHENAPAYCPDCDSYPESVMRKYKSKPIINRDNVEIRDQEHLMVAEGICDVKPSLRLVESYMADFGWLVHNIDIHYDTMQKFWRFSCDLDSKIKDDG